MKLRFLFFSLIFPLLVISCNKNKETTASIPDAVLKINVDYEKQAGPGSNQWAVWIEDSEGSIVKTLFVTRFTADGGYVPRPACIPIWVGKAQPAELSQETIDAFSGATPASGLQTYVWDSTDSDGNPVAKGTYTFVVEATLFGESEVIYKAPFTLGDKEFTVTAEPSYTSDDDKNKDLIRSVSAEYLLVSDSK
jgi:hypothetical protein